MWRIFYSCQVKHKNSIRPVTMYDDIEEVFLENLHKNINPNKPLDLTITS